MSDQDIFETDTTNPQETPAPQANPDQGDLFKDQLSTITDKDGRQKYDDVNKALEALKASQEFIPTLEQENAALKAELEKRESVEDVVKRLQGNQVTEETPKVESLDAEAIKSLVSSELSNREVQAIEAQNMLTVTQTMTQKYGAKAKEAIAAKAGELGTDTKSLQTMARTQPKVFLALFGSTPVSTSTNPTSSSTVPVATPQAPREVEAPKKSVLQGVKTEDLVSHWREHKAAVYDKFDIES